MSVPHININLPAPLQDTNENRYEIMWKARLMLFQKFQVAGAASAFEIFATLDNFERQFSLGVEKSDNPDKPGEKLLNGVVAFIPRPDADRQNRPFKLDERLDKVLNYVDDSIEEIIELGCGYGRRLIELQYLVERPSIKYIGAEYTQSGQDILSFLNQFAPADQKIQVEHTDHCKAEFPFITKDKKTLVFTCHSIEQVKEIPQDFFVKLCATADQMMGVHIEPFGFQTASAEERTPVQQKHKTFIENQGYNQNLLACLEYAEKKGCLTILKKEIDFAFDQPENPSSLIVWQKN